MLFTKYTPLLAVIIIFATFYILKRYNERRHVKYTEAVRGLDKDRDLSAKYGSAANGKLRFAPPQELNLLPAKLRNIRHDAFGPLKMEMPMKKGYRFAQICGFLVFGISLLLFLYIQNNPDALADDVTAVAASVGLCLLMLAGLPVGIGFFWGREKLRFYEYGMVYQRGKTKIYAYADIEDISLDKRPMHYKGGNSVIGYKLVAVIRFNNASCLEITGEKLKGFPNRLILWQQYLVRD